MAATARHFFHDPTALVEAALWATTQSNPYTTLDPRSRTVSLKAEHRPGRQHVAVISGGGCGHEPSFAGLVGPGLLSAAVSGTIFASPNAQQVSSAITAERQQGGRDVLVIVMNYTGDVLNFGLAVERVRAASNCSPDTAAGIEMVVVGDDVGVGRAKASKVGRRGIAGTVLVHKISGALAARGYSLERVAQAARVVAANLVSVGARLERVHVPGQSGPGPDPGSSTEAGIEIGVGIHNEGGSGVVAGGAVSDVVRQMLAQLLDPRDQDRAYLPLDAGYEVVLLINNLGAVSPLELAGIVYETTEQLRASYGISPVRIMNGTYMSSLNAQGFSITLLRVVPLNVEAGLSMVDLLDDPCGTVGWIPTIPTTTTAAIAEQRTAGAAPPVPSDALFSTNGIAHGNYPHVLAQTALVAALQRVIAEEPAITHFDTIVGDGDCGTGMKRGAQSVLDRLLGSSANDGDDENITALLIGDAATDLAAITAVLEATMDGTSGAIYAIFMHALTGAVRRMAPKKTTMACQDWAAALSEARKTLDRYTPARIGDRTLVDALHPFIETLRDRTNNSSGGICSPGDAIVDAAAAARAGAEATKGMRASLGRTVYISGDGFREVPDPGAWGLACFLEALAAGIQAGL